MLTLMQINKAVDDTIESALHNTEFATVSVWAKDISEPIKRPSLKVAIGPSKNGRLNASYREKTLTIRVYFFASNLKKYKIENTKMQDILESAFLDGVYVNGAYIPIETVESDVTDTVLICSFDLYIAELVADKRTIDPETGEEINPETGDPIEIMETLEIEEEFS